MWTRINYQLRKDNPKQFLFLPPFMRIISDILLLTTCLSLLCLASCGDDELEVDTITPTVKAKFINGDSLQKVKTLITEINAEITAIDDSVAALETLIDEGDETDYTENFLSLDEKRDELTTEKSSVTKIKTTIESGDVFIQKISGTGAIGEITFTDSSTSYSLPLNVNADISDFLIQINDTEYGVSLSYERDTLLKEGFIAIEANQIKLIEFSAFDSVKFPCDTLNCKSYEASATLYF